MREGEGREGEVGRELSFDPNISVARYLFQKNSSLVQNVFHVRNLSCRMMSIRYSRRHKKFRSADGMVNRSCPLRGKESNAW